MWFVFAVCMDMYGCLHSDTDTHTQKIKEEKFGFDMKDMNSVTVALFSLGKINHQHSKELVTFQK